MMAIIISCTSVARDAFESHVRKVARMGRPFPTFPDGAALRTMVGSHAMEFAPGSQSVSSWRPGRSLGHWSRRVRGRPWSSCPLWRCWGARSLSVPTLAGFVQRGHGPKACSRRRRVNCSSIGGGLDFLCRDVLSCGGGMCDFPLETAGDSHCLCHGRWRIRDRLMALYCYYLGFRRQVEDNRDTRCRVPCSDVPSSWEFLASQRVRRLRLFCSKV